MATWRTLKDNKKTNLPTQDIIDTLLDSMTADSRVDRDISGSVAITGSLKVVGIASGAVVGSTASVQTTPYAFIISGSHTEPDTTSGGVVGEWRICPPYLYICTGSITGNWLVFTGAQV